MKWLEVHIDTNHAGLDDLVTEIRYLYSTPLNLYKADLSDGIFQVNPNNIFAELGMESTSSNSMMSNMEVWKQLTSNRDLLDSQ